MENSLQDVLNSMQVVCTELTKVINLNIIVIFIGIILSSTLVLYVGWFGIRTLINSMKNALHGNLSVGSFTSNTSDSYSSNSLGIASGSYLDNLYKQKKYKLKKIWEREKNSGLYDNYSDFVWSCFSEDNDGNMTDIDGWYNEIYN